ncbi:MAG: TRAP transporter large permease [Planctomycetota bacterium]|jgi:tripartite ATP-independent transporter DctM subunit|nr:TRAP transporter large permease [Planctomycetota bacterium]
MLIVTLAFVVFLVFGMPVAFVIGISGFLYFLCNSDVPTAIAVQRFLATTQSFTMLAIPLFIFAGHLMNHTGITQRMVKLSDVLTGHMYGNIAQISCVLSTLMGGVSGSAVADAAMESRVLGPAMIKRGYSRGWSAAINGLSSIITSTIPPSMGLILFGSVGEVSIGRLFAGGILPGILMMAALMATVSISARRRNYLPERARGPTLREVFTSFYDCLWALLFPIILIFGIRFGLFTPSEAGAFAVVYAVFVGRVIHRELTWEKFRTAVFESGVDIGAVMLIIACAGIFGFGIVYDRVPQFLAGFLISFTNNSYLMFLAIIIFLILAGMFMETTVITLLMTPILLPVAIKVGIDPVHFGLVMMTTVQLGIMSPPVGVALYTVSGILECSPQETAREAIPFFIAILVLIAVMVFWPGLVLFIPNLIFGV